MNAIRKFGLGLVAAAALVPGTVFGGPCYWYAAPVARVAPAPAAVVARAPAAEERRTFSYEPAVVAAPRYVAPRYVAPAIGGMHDAAWKINQ